MKRLLVLLALLWPLGAVAQPVPVTWRPPSTCSTGQALVWNGTIWTCGTVASTAAGTVNVLAKYTSASALGNSDISSTGTLNTFGDATSDRAMFNGIVDVVGDASSRFIYLDNLGTNYGVIYDSGGKIHIGGAATVGGAPVVASFEINPNTSAAQALGTFNTIGDLSVATNKFTVAAANGNTDVGGVLSTGSNIYLKAGNEIHYLSDTTADAGAFINYYSNGASGLSYFRDLYIANGKGATICTFTGSTLTANCSALTEGGSAVLSGAISANVIPKGSSGNLADSSITDNGTNVSTTENIVVATDNRYIGIDNAAPSGLGLVKKSGSTPAIAYATGIALNFSQSSGADVDPSTRTFSIVGGFDTSGNFFTNRNSTLGDTPASDTLLINGATTMKVSSTNTTLGGSTADGVWFYNQSNTANNLFELVFNDANNNTATTIATKFTDHTNHYGELRFVTRGADNYTTRETISQDGQIFVGDTGSSAIANNVDVLTVGNTGTANTTSGLKLLKLDASTMTFDLATDKILYGSWSDVRSPGVSGCGAPCTSQGGSMYDIAVYGNANGSGAFNYAAVFNDGQVLSADGIRIGGDTVGGAAGADNGDEQLYVTSSATGLTADYAAIGGEAAVTQNATAANRFAYGVYGIAHSSRSTGANSVTNYAGWFDAANGQNNYSLYTDHGDNLFNNTNGKSTFKQNVEIGDASSDTLTITSKINANVHYTGTAPSLSSCGSSPSIAGNDRRMKITAGTGSPTACTVTFNTAYTTNGPVCQVTAANVAYFAYVTSSTTTVLTLALTGTTSSSVYYISCDGYL